MALPTLSAQAAPTALVCGMVHSFGEHAPMDPNFMVTRPIVDGKAAISVPYKDLYIFTYIYDDASGKLTSSMIIKKYPNDPFTTEIKDFKAALYGYYEPIYDPETSSNIMHCVLK